MFSVYETLAKYQCAYMCIIALNNEKAVQTTNS